MPFISRNRNVISVPESCGSRKETASRYREVTVVTPFRLPSTDSLHFFQNQGKRKTQEKRNGFVDVFGEPVPKPKGHLKKCMFKIIMEGGQAMMISRRGEMLSVNFG